MYGICMGYVRIINYELSSTNYQVRIINYELWGKGCKIEELKT